MQQSLCYAPPNAMDDNADSQQGNDHVKDAAMDCAATAAIGTAAHTIDCDAPHPRANQANAPPRWVEQLRQNQGAGLREAYQDHHRVIRAFARRLLGEENAAEDLVQEVFLALPKVVQRYQGAAPVESFLLGIAANKARHFVRSAARRRKAYQRFAEELSPKTEAPDHHLARRQLAARLHDALERLSLKQRTAFVLCHVEERSAAEVATILGCPASTVRDRVRSARAELQRWATKEGLK